MPKVLLAFFLLLIFAGCTNFQSNRSIHIFIPMKYTGWVNLIFNDSSKKAVDPLTFNNGYVYLVTGDPETYKVKSDMFPSVKFDMHFYYYNTDTTIELAFNRYPKQNIFFLETIGSKSNNSYRSSIYAFSFYVSKDLLNENDLAEDKLPKNKILQ